MLALTFANEGDHDRISSSDRLSIAGLQGLSVGKTMTLKIALTERDRAPWDCEVKHTFTDEQAEYFRAGRALNLMANKASTPPQQRNASVATTR